MPRGVLYFDRVDMRYIGSCGVCFTSLRIRAISAYMSGCTTIHKKRPCMTIAGLMHRQVRNRNSSSVFYNTVIRAPKQLRSVQEDKPKNCMSPKSRWISQRAHRVRSTPKRSSIAIYATPWWASHLFAREDQKVCGTTFWSRRCCAVLSQSVS